MKRFLPALIFCLSLTPELRAEEIRFPSFFGNHMVLQRHAPIPIWGWAAPGSKVTVKLGDTTGETVADEAGRWKVALASQEANATGLSLTASSGENSTTLTDVLIGEVWLCSGQSNMEWTVRQSANPGEEIAAANHPLIRQMKIQHLTGDAPKEDVNSDWYPCSPEGAGNFTAAGYYMARELQRELQVPIGLLNISWGGTRIEPWIPLEGYAAVPELENIYNQVLQSRPDSEAYQTTLRNHIEAVSQWTVEAQSALANRERAPFTPEFPPSLKPLTTAQSPAAIFNAMMAPVVGYGMRGAIWYQGESNHTEGMLYYHKKRALLEGWRQIWGVGEFPFYFVQIAPFQYGQEDPEILPEFWEAQAACLDLPKTGMVVTSDIGDIKDIHPKNKQEVGRRLSLLALKHTYGKTDLVASGPVFETMQVEENVMKLTFSNVAGGLKSRDGKELSHFEIAGKGTGFVKANATIEGANVVLLHSPEVAAPTAMRFAWHKLAEPNLMNGANLPASAFRAGEVPRLDTLGENVPTAATYELVYDLDLTTLSANIKYEVDRSAEVKGNIDQVGYYIELIRKGGTLEWAWVTMDPFTEDLKKLGVPFHGTGIKWQKSVSGLKVSSSFPGLSTESGTGNLEFWATNYGHINNANVPGASSARWDIGDNPEGTGAGYGSMQIHNTGTKQTIFAINNWRSGISADVGIGNSTGKTDDWTFAANAGSLIEGRLRILVKKSQ